MTPKSHRPQKLESKSLEIPCPCGRIYIHITFDANNRPFEIFTRLGKQGGCASATTSGVAIASSLAIRSGADPLDMANGLIGISCHRSPAYDGETKITSCIDAIGRALRELTPNQEA